jgi:hypothetical protein
MPQASGSSLPGFQHSASGRTAVEHHLEQTVFSCLLDKECRASSRNKQTLFDSLIV